MSESPKIICLLCGGTCHKVPVVSQFIYPADATWHAENNGKGKYISGLGKRNDPSSYAKSLTDAQEKAKAKGLSYELA